MEIGTLDELKTIQSLVSKLQWEYIRQGLDNSAARNKASDDVGATYSPPISGAELQSTMFKAMAVFHADSRNDGQRKAYEKIKSAKTDAMIDESDGSQLTFVDRYRHWCSHHDHVASDGELAYFLGAAKATFGYSRKSLINDGFSFEKNGNGWNITHPVIEETYTASQVRELMQKQMQKQMQEQAKQIEELLKKLGKIE